MSLNNIKLFSIPFSGGNAYSYSPFRKYLPENIELRSLELPGRGKRFSETLLKSIDAMTEDLFRQIENMIDGPYAIFGHSLGALLGVTLCRYISERRLNLPLILILSGQTAPSLIEQDNRYSLPDDEFVNMLRQMEGTPEELLGDKDFIRFFLPIIKADFQAIGCYSYSPPENMPETPISIVLGSKENIRDEDAAQWKLETKNAVSVDRFEGGHFFIFNHTENLCRLIAEKIELAAL
ncbi:MAG TPA: alpha/beta fold hydrolase [Ignavibacteriales bacterium]|nr:alpha/beta fold hydrolase [Ignavibacteriales bacterium]